MTTDSISETSKEASESDYTGLANAGRGKALEMIKDQFEDPSKPFDYLYYHNQDHTLGLLSRAEQLIEAYSREGIMIDNKDKSLIRIACAFHDAVQGYKLNDITVFKDSEGKLDDNSKGALVPAGSETFVYKKRVRSLGENEKLSADKAIEYMQECNEKANKTVYDARDMFIVRAGIESTIPGFGPLSIKTESGTGTVLSVKQDRFSYYIDLYKSGQVVEELGRPLSKADMMIIATTAISDLGSSGMEGGTSSMVEGDKIFCEDNPEIGAEIVLGKKIVPEDFKPYFKQKILIWGEGQVTFPIAMRDNLCKKMSEADPEIGNVLSKELLPSNFDEGSVMSSAMLASRENMSWEELVEDMRSVVSTHAYSN
jgi:hypothetical protein